MGNTQLINWDPLRISTKNGYLTHPTINLSIICGLMDQFYLLYLYKRHYSGCTGLNKM